MKNNTAINKKGQTVKLPSGCTPCDALVSFDSFYLYNPGKIGQSFTAVAEDITNYNPTNSVTYPNFGKTVGMYGRKIWGVDTYTGGIYEWEIDYDLCEAKHINTHYLKSGVGGWPRGACMKDANTLWTGSSHVAGNPSNVQSILEINVGSPNPTTSTQPISYLNHIVLFNLPQDLRVMGDISYVASTNTILAFLQPIGTGPGRWLYHFDISGNVLSFDSFGPWGTSILGVGSLFHYAGKEYLSEYTGFGDVYEIGMNPVSTTLTNLVSAPPYTSDMASAPDTKSFECGTSWECVQIGSHPKFGFKCVEIQGTVGTAGGGQYATKQDCISGGCEGINPDPGIPTGGGPFFPLSPLVGGTGGLTGTPTEDDSGGTDIGSLPDEPSSPDEGDGIDGV